MQVHDIEDLAKVGKDHKACPYYAATHFAGELNLSVLTWSTACLVQTMHMDACCNSHSLASQAEAMKVSMHAAAIVKH